MTAGLNTETTAALLMAFLGVSASTGQPLTELLYAALGNSSLLRLHARADVDPAPGDEPGLLPSSARFEAFLSLIERDNPSLHRKLMNLD